MDSEQEPYDPLEDAHRLVAEGNAAEALEVLDAIPAELLDSPEAKAVVALEKQYCYLEGDKQSTKILQVARFFRAQQQFYRAIAELPRLHRAYHQQAEFWHELGNDAMAVRLLRSIERVAPHAQTRALLGRYGDGAGKREGAPGKRSFADAQDDLRSTQNDTKDAPNDRTTIGADAGEASPEAVPMWSGTTRPRILVITHRHADYGTDTLYDGLCSVLGDDRVTEFPYKPFLHGQGKEEVGTYPCFFERAGEPKDAERIEEELRNGDYDVMLFADMIQDNDRETARKLVAAGSRMPLFIVDMWDDCGDNTPMLLEFLGCSRFDGYFKREMLAGGHYWAGMTPLPFGYADARIPRQVAQERQDDFFWAGHRVFGLRRLYLEHLEDLFGTKLDKTYTQEEYVQALARARIGLNLFGFGFDTVRFYELPAHGCMLLSERPPIYIPNNFRDGESAVFFDDLPDLEEKLAYYLSHPDETVAIAQAGYEHLKRYHTTSVRARQLLGHIEQTLGWVQ